MGQARCHARHRRPRDWVRSRRCCTEPAVEGCDVSVTVVELTRRGKLVVGEPYFEADKSLLLDTKGLGDASAGDLAVVRPGRGRAKLEYVLGRAEDIEAVLEGLLVQRGLREPFEPFDPPEPSIAGRVDLRDLLTFTIDPETAKDFDDAISARREADGVRVWVHIADVSYFVQGGTPLDGGAGRRAFSTYVPGRVAPMLPPELADDLCSLRAGVDRLCVTIEVAPGGAASFYRSVIRSDARLDYGQAQRIVTGDKAAGPELAEALALANGVAEDLRRRRFARGALRIERPEVQFAFDRHGGVERAWREEEPAAHALIEELMILANEQVAGLLAGRRREALYRVHERPDPQSIRLLLAKLAALEVPTPPAPEHLSPSEAARLVGETSEAIASYVQHAGRGREAFPSLVLRALKQARYYPQNLGHSGLASAAYCHFTSPIRRYPDLVVHRALLKELGLSDEPLPGGLEDLAEHTSAREREAADVEYQADAFCAAWLLDNQLFHRGWEETWEGEIIGLIGSGIFVRFGEVFEGYLPLRRLPGWWTLDPTATRLEGQHGGVHRLGDPIEVKVERIDKHNGKVELNPA